MNDKISKEYSFLHPKAKVWDAITDGKKISEWFIKTNFEAIEGFAYTFMHQEGEECTTINGTVLKVNPTDKLVYTWVVEGTEIVTTVSWTLTQTESGTKLLLEHSGISKYPADAVTPMFESFSSGWDGCASSLDKFLSGVNV